MLNRSCVLLFLCILKLGDVLNQINTTHVDGTGILCISLIIAWQADFDNPHPSIWQ